MSLSNAVQAMVFSRLTTDATVTALVGQRVYDPPRPDAQAPYISFGPAYSVEDDAECVGGIAHVIQIDIWSEAKDGQRECKAIVDAVRRSLHHHAADLGDHALVDMEVSLTRILRDPAECWHGVVQVEMILEEADGG